MRDLLKAILFSVVFVGQPSYGGLAPERWVIEFKNPPSAPELSEIRALPGVKTVERLDATDTSYFRRAYVVDISGLAGDLARAKITVRPQVASLEKVSDTRFFSITPPNGAKPATQDPFSIYQWALLNQGQRITRDIDDVNTQVINGSVGADLEWAPVRDHIGSRLTRDLVVAVIDSGIDITHPDLAGSILKNSAGQTLGWNFSTPNLEGNNQIADDTGHGTHVAGIIAATSGNGIGISGISSRLKILPIKVLGAKGSAGLSDHLTKAVLYATKLGADVINLSMGWPEALDTQHLREAIRFAQSQGIWIVAAAGNDAHSEPVFPCAYEGVICVGATGPDGRLAPFSNYGGRVDVQAPGEQILSTIPVRMTPLQFFAQGYDVKNGTSQASPYVAALIALLKGTYPNADRDEISARLFQSARSLPEGDEHRTVDGMVRFQHALQGDLTPSLRPLFKRLDRVQVQDDLSFGFPLSIRNFGSATSGIRIQVRSLSPDVTFSTSAASLGDVGHSEERTVTIRGSVTSLDVDQRFEYEVEIDSGDTVVGRYRDGTLFTRVVNFAESGKVIPIDAASSSQAFNLRSIGQLYADRKLSEFFLAETSHDTLKPGIGVRVLREIDGRLTRIEPVLWVPNAAQIITVTQMDCNFDGQVDYLVRSVVLDPLTNKLKVSYSFFASDGRPLYGNLSHWLLDPSAIGDNPGQLIFAKMHQPLLGNVAVPMFEEQGTIPPADQKSDAWHPADDSVKNRIYYLSPVVDAKGPTVNLELRLLDTPSVIQHLSNARGLYRGEAGTVQLVGLLAQSRDQFARGEYWALYSHGRDYPRHFTLAKWSGLEGPSVAFLPTDEVPPNVDRSTLASIFRLDGDPNNPGADPSDSKSATAFFSFYSPQEARSSAVFWNSAKNAFVWGQSSPLRWPVTRGPLAGYMSVFASASRMDAFFFSTSELILQRTSQDGTSRTFARALHRYSFMPGTLLSELHFPIAVGATGDRRAGLYVDSSQIHNRLLSVIVATEDRGLVSPLRFGVEMDDHCTSLNPTYRPDQDAYSYQLLCTTPVGGYELRILGLK